MSINLKKILVVMFPLILAACDGSNSTSGSNSTPMPTPTPAPAPAPSKQSVPKANNVTAKIYNGQFTGAYSYYSEESIEEGKSQLYWKDGNGSIVGSGAYLTIFASRLNKDYSFCVLPVDNNGLQGGEVCSDPIEAKGTKLNPDVVANTVHKGELLMFHNLNITPDTPSQFGLKQLEVSYFYTPPSDNSRNYNTNDFATNIDKANNAIGIRNYTNRYLMHPVVKITNMDGSINFAYVNFELQPFQEIDMNMAPEDIQNIKDLMLIDPEPFFQLQIDRIVSPTDTDMYTPDPHGGREPVDDNMLLSYNQLIDYTKYYNNRFETLEYYYAWMNNTNNSLNLQGDCEHYSNGGPYFGCHNSDYSTHGYSRILKTEDNTDYYQDYSGSGGQQAGGATPGQLSTDWVSVYGVGITGGPNYQSQFFHEHNHSIGYNHQSGVVSGWTDEFEHWIAKQPFYDYNSSGAYIPEESDYIAEWKWLDNKTISIAFHGKYDGVHNLTSLDFLAEDEQDPTDFKDPDSIVIEGDGGPLGIEGHQNNDFSIDEVYQTSPNTLIITLHNPMRYMGNSISVLGGYDHSRTKSGYISFSINNTNDINVNDMDVNAFIVDALLPDYKEAALFNGASNLKGKSHTPGIYNNQGIDDGGAPVNWYNYKLSNYMSWNTQDALEYCKKIGKSGLAKINSDDVTINKIRNKYLNEAGIIALNEYGIPTVYKNNEADTDVGQIIACSME